MISRRVKAATGFALAAFGGAAPTPARADVRWDVGAQAGAIARFVSNESPKVASPGAGPVFELHGHLALFPMVRFGPYLSHDIAPRGGASARENTEVGVRLKLTPPLLRAPLRMWLFAGAGYVRAYGPSRSYAADSGVAHAPGAGGGYVDFPFGVGLSRKVRSPWSVFAELSGRVSCAFTGSLYERSLWREAFPFGGRDSFAVALSLGVSFEP